MSNDPICPESVTFADGQVRIRFGGIGGGLVAGEGDLKGFEVSADGTAFVAATAEIQEAMVLVSSPDVANPVAVRYAWAGWPEATLANREGLPATPFRYLIP